MAVSAQLELYDARANQPTPTDTCVCHDKIHPLPVHLLKHMKRIRLRPYDFSPVGPIIELFVSNVGAEDDWDL